MVAPLPARRIPVPHRQLFVLVNQALHDLSDLHHCAVQLRAHEKYLAEADLSPRKLDSLIALIRDGQRNLLRHQSDLPPVPGEPAMATGAARRDTARAPSAVALLIADYKRCSRHVGIALQAARDARAYPMAESLYQLLRNLEKQLWLLNASPQRPVRRFALVGLFQAG